MSGSAPEQFEGMPRRLLPASPSRLTTYVDCPRRYRFAYVDRPPPPKGPPWAHNSFGAAVHSALASWWKEPVDRRTPGRAEELVRAGWLTDGYRDPAQSAAAMDYAAAMVGNYTAGLDPTDEPVGVERTVALKTTHAALFGRVDRIDMREGDALVIVDYKAGRHLLTVDDARTSLALAVYAAGAARTLRRDCQRVELHHLPTGEVLAWEHPPEALSRHLARADSIAAEIAELDVRRVNGEGDQDTDRLYPAAPGPLCAWCDYLRSCPEGRRVASAQPSWAGLPDDLQ